MNEKLISATSTELAGLMMGYMPSNWSEFLLRTAAAEMAELVHNELVTELRDTIRHLESEIADLRAGRS